jgi:enoyl-CoA hydratase/carnithine racemase
MSAQAVRLERMSAHVALVTLNRPEARNAINGDVARALDAIVGETENDHQIRVVVLAGEGDAVFCAGADLKVVAAGRGEELWTDRGFGGFSFRTHTKPWIAAVEGAALAGGCELALSCELIVASEASRFGLPEVTRGLVAAAGGLYRLPQRLPPTLAMELILTGEPMDARTAHAHGLVNQLCTAGGARAAALALAGRIARNAPLALRESLLLARAAGAMSEEQGQAASLAARQRIRHSADAREGAQAFVEKRPPRWSGT